MLKLSKLTIHLLYPPTEMVSSRNTEAIILQPALHYLAECIPIGSGLSFQKKRNFS